MPAIHPNDSGLLSELDFSIMSFPYKSKEQCSKVLNEEFTKSSQGPPADIIEWILFTDVDANVFNRDFSNPEIAGDRITGNWTSYDNRNNYLLFRMPLSPHQAAANQLDYFFRDALGPMGLAKALQPLAGADVQAPDGNKQPDRSWVPRRLPRDRSRHWPSVVLEVAYSEANSKLMSDVRFWLAQSQGDVKVVLTTKINRRRPEVVLEKWELVDDRRQRTQRVTISKNRGITVEGDPLVIEFEKLFLRPTEIPRETDIHISAEDLEQYAIQIWEQQGFVELGTEPGDLNA